MVYLNLYGVRGSLPCPGADFTAFGGNTACLMVEGGSKPIILDAGSGLHNLGRDFIAKHGEQAVMLLSHLHLDHILGLPFFRPLFNSRFNMDVYADHLTDGATFHDILGSVMTPPFFPIDPTGLRANIDIHHFSAGATLHPTSDIRVETLRLNHPGDSIGYKIHLQGKTIVYMTDIEHHADQDSRLLVDFMQGCDLVLFDSMYDDANFAKHIGWGHSTWQTALKLAGQAQPKQFLLFHHDIDATDGILQDRQAQIDAMALPFKASLAVEGQRIAV